MPSIFNPDADISSWRVVPGSFFIFALGFGIDGRLLHTYCWATAPLHIVLYIQLAIRYWKNASYTLI